MRDMTVGKVLCLGFLVPTLLGWDKFPMPNFRNGYEYTVRVVIEYSDNVPANITLKPEVGFRYDKEEVTFISITVYSEDGVLLAEYPEEVLNELKAKSVDDYEFWVVTEEGLFLLPEGHTSPNTWREYLESIQQ